MAIQEEPNGTGDAVRSAADHIDPDDHRARALRRRAADHRRGDPRARARPRGERRGGHDGDDGARRPERLRARRPRRATGGVERVVETKTPGDATPEEEAIREVNTGVYAFDGRRPARRRSTELRSDNAQGELYLPDVLPLLRADGQGDRRAPGHRPDAHARRQRPRRARAGRGARPGSASTDAHTLAGVTIVDPASTLIDADVEIGATRSIEPGTLPARRDARSARAARSARSRR